MAIGDRVLYVAQMVLIHDGTELICLPGAKSRWKTFNNSAWLFPANVQKGTSLEQRSLSASLVS